MGVSGCGKSTIGSALASKLNRPFKDGDSFHPPENVKKMRSGVPLTDSDRFAWLQTINVFARNHPGHVIACSSLKKSYRSILCEHLNGMFILLNLKRQVQKMKGEKEVLQKRVGSRPGHFMPSSLLDSQLATLEMPADDEMNVIVIDANQDDVDEIVNSIVSVLKL
uniref:Gluconokinase n=1 Tax=Caenorhabditis tropicalis TaxID=1561998 RepID=A0A1I7SZM4_9PELO